MCKKSLFLFSVLPCKLKSCVTEIHPNPAKRNLFQPRGDILPDPRVVGYRPRRSCDGSPAQLVHPETKRLRLAEEFFSAQQEWHGSQSTHTNMHTRSGFLLNRSTNPPPHSHRRMFLPHRKATSLPNPPTCQRSHTAYTMAHFRHRASRQRDFPLRTSHTHAADPFHCRLLFFQRNVSGITSVVRHAHDTTIEDRAIRDIQPMTSKPLHRLSLGRACPRITR